MPEHWGDRKSARPGSASPAWVSSAAAVLEGGQAGAARQLSDESTCEFCESRLSLLEVSLPLRIPRPWFTAGAVKDSLGLRSRKKYKGSSIQRHLIKYPFKPHADLQEGSEWPSGGFYLPISTGQCRVHAQTLWMELSTQPHDFFQVQTGGCIHTSGLQQGWEGHGWCLGQAIASSKFMSTNFLSASVLHWGNRESLRGETWGSTRTARDVLCSRVPQVNVGLGNGHVPVKQNT